MLNEETMHTGVGDMKGHSQGSYTRRGNANMALDPPWGNQGGSGDKIPRGNQPLATKYLGKTKRINKEAYARRRDATEYARTRNYLLCEHSVLGK